MAIKTRKKIEKGYKPHPTMSSDMIEKMVVSGVRGFVPLGKERLSIETISCRIPESKMESLKSHLTELGINKSQWARKVIEDAIADME